MPTRFTPRGREDTNPSSCWKEAENEEIVDIVRGMSISLEELPLVLQRIKAGDALGQNVPKSAGPEKEDAE